MEVVKNQKSISDLAKEEVKQENLDKAKDELKKKIKNLYDAKAIVANLEREIEFLEKKVTQEFKVS